MQRDHSSEVAYLDPVTITVDENYLDADVEEIEETKQETFVAANGFCKDDIYSKYLRQQYRLKNKPKKYKSRRSRQRYEKRRKLAALTYAKDRMVGPADQDINSLPLVNNVAIEKWITYFKTTGRRSFLKWLIRGESVRGTLAPLLAEYGVPEDLFYLAMVESGFSNHAYSRAKATGTWQFMKGTAKLYGLRVDHWVDERRDPVHSTMAAARFLKDLYGRFGDWFLALAAYNAGPGKVNRAIRRVKTRDFWKIAKTRYLRRETKDYVPKILAAMTIARNPDLYGFVVEADPNISLPQTYVDLVRPILLKEVSKYLEVSSRTIKKWNPELVRGIVPPSTKKKPGPYRLRLPSDLIAKFNDIEPKLSYLEIKAVHFHKIRSGDTLYGLARRYKIPMRSILKVNPKLSPSRLRIGKRVAIPVPSVSKRKKV